MSQPCLTERWGQPPARATLHMRARNDGCLREYMIAIGVIDAGYVPSSQAWRATQAKEHTPTENWMQAKAPLHNSTESSCKLCARSGASFLQWQGRTARYGCAAPVRTCSMARLMATGAMARVGAAGPECHTGQGPTKQDFNECRPHVPTKKDVCWLDAPVGARLRPCLAFAQARHRRGSQRPL